MESQLNEAMKLHEKISEQSFKTELAYCNLFKKAIQKEHCRLLSIPKVFHVGIYCSVCMNVDDDNDNHIFPVSEFEKHIHKEEHKLNAQKENEMRKMSLIMLEEMCYTAKYGNVWCRACNTYFKKQYNVLMDHVKLDRHQENIGARKFMDSLTPYSRRFS